MCDLDSDDVISRVFVCASQGGMGGMGGGMF